MDTKYEGEFDSDPDANSLKRQALAQQVMEVREYLRKKATQTKSPMESIRITERFHPKVAAHENAGSISCGSLSSTKQPKS
jgi:hypothetical protein